MQWSAAPAPAWKSATTLCSRDLYLGGSIPCVLTAPPCDRNCKKKNLLPLTKEIFWFSFRQRNVSRGVLEFSKEEKSQGEKGKHDGHPNKLLSEKAPSLVSSSKWRRQKSTHLLSFFRNYFLTQQEKNIIVRAQKDSIAMTKQTKVNLKPMAKAPFVARVLE